MTPTTITEETVRKAVLGASIMNNRELFASYNGRVPRECFDAIQLIQSNCNTSRHRSEGMK